MFRFVYVTWFFLITLSPLHGYSDCPWENTAHAGATSQSCVWNEMLGTRKDLCFWLR